MSESDRHINFKLLRDHILSAQDSETPRAGKKYWRSLEELADTPVFREFVAREFPQQAESWHDPIERRIAEVSKAKKPPEAKDEGREALRSKDDESQ